jgi:hypothetical protein
MRPRSIVLFERLYGLNIALAVVSLVWIYHRLNLMSPDFPAGAPTGMRQYMALATAGVAAVSIAIRLLLWFFVARRGSNVARWAFVIFFVLTIGGLFRAFDLHARGTMSMFGTGLWMLDFLTKTICVWWLFRPDAVAWFRGERVSGDLHDTFS